MATKKKEKAPAVDTLKDVDDTPTIYPGSDTLAIALNRALELENAIRTHKLLAYRAGFRPHDHQLYKVIGG